MLAWLLSVDPRKPVSQHLATELKKKNQIDRPGLIDKENPKSVTLGVRLSFFLSSFSSFLVSQSAVVPTAVQQEFMQIDSSTAIHVDRRKDALGLCVVACVAHRLAQLQKLTLV
jgi:hypothetical protein